MLENPNPPSPSPAETRRWFARGLACAVVAGFLLLHVGCATAPPAVETAGVGAASDPGAAVCPPRMQALADALVRHRVQTGAWPVELRELVFSGKLVGLTPAQVSGFGYAGRPMGVLPDGRLLRALDSQPSDDGLLVWCLVETPSPPPGLPLLEVVAVPLSTLDSVAARS